MPHDFLFGPDTDSLGRLLTVHGLMRERASESWQLGELARRAGMSPFHFLRSFRKTFRQTPHRLVMEVRLARAKRFLLESNLPITEICFECGYESLGSFSSLFRRTTGCSPREYRQRRRHFWPVNFSGIQPFTPFCLLDGFRGPPNK